MSGTRAAAASGILLDASRHHVNGSEPIGSNWNDAWRDSHHRRHDRLAWNQLARPSRWSRDRRHHQKGEYGNPQRCSERRFALVDVDEVLIGKAEMFGNDGIAPLSPAMAQSIEQLRQDGHTSMIVRRDGKDQARSRGA